MSCKSKISGIVYGIFHVFRNFYGTFHISGIFPEFFKFRKKYGMELPKSGNSVFFPELQQPWLRDCTWKIVG